MSWLKLEKIIDERTRGHLFFFQCIEFDFHTYVGMCTLNALSKFVGFSVISWRLVLLVEETGVPGENHQLAASN